MVKTSEHACGGDLSALSVDFPWTRYRDLLRDPLVRATRIEKSAVFKEHVIEMPVAKNDDVIQAFAPGTTEESFANRIGRDSRMQMMGRVRRRPFA